MAVQGPRVCDLPDVVTPEEHHEWALALWKRMDRDASDSITRQELDCEDFYNVIHSVLAPKGNAGTGGVTYARARHNASQALDFCLRKADCNHDNSLSFNEFKAFLACLRNRQDAQYTANLIFALFDLDADQTIDEEEFREIYRYFLGHHPLAAEFQAEWERLDWEGRGRVSRDDYVRWLQTSQNPVFKQHAPPIQSGDDTTMLTKSPSLPGVRTAEGRQSDRPRWNQYFNTKANINTVMPSRRRNYFSRPQSLPELTRFYQTRRGFADHRKALTQPEPRSIRVLDSEVGLPERHLPGGRMRGPKREKVVWNDHWQEPESLKQKYQPGTLLLRTPGHPPRWLLQRTEEDYAS